MPLRFPSVLLLALALASPACQGKPKLNGAQKEHLLKTLAGIRARGVEEDQKRRKGLEAAAMLVPRPDLGRCPVQVPKPPDLTRRRTFTNLAAVEAAQLLEVVDRGKAPEGPGPLWRRLQSRMGLYESSIQRDDVESFGPSPGSALLEQVSALPDPAKWDYDLYLLADEHVEAAATADGFERGRLKGRLFVWSYKTHEIVCAANAGGTSSS